MGVRSSIAQAFLSSFKANADCSSFYQRFLGLVDEYVSRGAITGDVDAHQFS
jgi:hypothetical protein